MNVSCALLQCTILSGFLIAGILLDSGENQNFFKNFYARQILKIFPIYYVLLSIFLGIIHPLLRSYEYETGVWTKSSGSEKST
jgi:peptidoglycan/LPS O-acetylase OafA/YrhL